MEIIKMIDVGSHSGGVSDNDEDVEAHPDDSCVVKFGCEIREKRYWCFDEKGYWSRLIM